MPWNPLAFIIIKKMCAGRRGVFRVMKFYKPYFRITMFLGIFSGSWNLYGNIEYRITFFSRKDAVTPISFQSKRWPHFPCKSCIFLWGVFNKNIGFQRKSWIETHIKSHILDIMDQKLTLCEEPILSTEDPLKKQR